MKNISKVIFWFSLAVPALLFFIFLLQTYDLTKTSSGIIRQEITSLKGKKINFTSLPKFAFELKTAFATQDARPLVIQKYMRHYQSPMEKYARYIVDIADANGVDPYLVVAIAQQESNLGKLMPPNCHNAWGWGIHSKGTLCFDNWEEGINTFISGLSQNYLAYGLKTPEEIMTKYNSSSPGGAWAKGVSYFLNQLQSGNW